MFAEIFDGSMVDHMLDADSNQNNNKMSAEMMADSMAK